MRCSANKILRSSMKLIGVCQILEDPWFRSCVIDHNLSSPLNFCSVDNLIWVRKSSGESKFSPRKSKRSCQTNEVSKLQAVRIETRHDMRISGFFTISESMSHTLADICPLLWSSKIGCCHWFSIYLPQLINFSFRTFFQAGKKESESHKKSKLVNWYFDSFVWFSSRDRQLNLDMMIVPRNKI